MKDSKNLVIGLLCAVVCVMAVAYAAFTQNLNINGTAEITSEWNVRFTTISCSTTGTAVDNSSNVTTQTGLTATVNFTLTAPGDSAYCDITIANQGTLPAKYTGVSYGSTTAEKLAESPIMIVVSEPGATLAKGSTDKVRVTATYDSNVTSAPTGEAATKTATITLNYVQNLG